MSSKITYAVSDLTGFGTVHVLTEQRLQKDYLSQLAPWIQCGTDHVYSPNGKKTFKQYFQTVL